MNAIERLELSARVVAALIERAPASEWTNNALGMLRLALSPRCRLHLWHPLAERPGVTLMHNHQWPFESLVVAGVVRNRKYRVTGTARGQGATHLGAIVHHTAIEDSLPCRVDLASDVYYGRGESYVMWAEEVHEATATPGAVTLVRRGMRQDPARVFWPIEEKWVSAAPGRATPEEVRTAVADALAVISRENGV